MKRPRVYAAEIMAAPGHRRKVLFEAVPDHLKALTKAHCYCTRDRQRSKKNDRSNPLM